MTYVVHFWVIFVSCGPCVRSRARPCAAICYSSFLDHFWRISAPPRVRAVRVGPCVWGRASGAVHPGPCRAVRGAFVAHFWCIFDEFLAHFWTPPRVRAMRAGPCVRDLRAAVPDRAWRIF